MTVKRDPVSTDSDGTRHYTRDRARGTAGGPAQWSSEHDCNPICGCHLAAKCRNCNCCLECEGCYCNED